jgi:hypothetical protein
MNFMKGPSAVVIACQLTPQTAVSVVRYLDGTWGVTRAGATLGVWETEDLDECFRAFAVEVGINDLHEEQTVLLRVRCAVGNSLN